MIPFFIFIGILIFILFSNILLYLSTLEVEVKKLIYNKERNINIYLIYVRLKLFNKITWLKTRIDNKKIERYKLVNNKLLEKINFDFKNGNIDLKGLVKIKGLNIKLNRINLKIEIGVLDTLITSLSVGFLSSLISIIIAKTIDCYNLEKCRFKVMPIYNKNSQVKINLNCIINVKMVHIINILYLLLKKGSVSDGNKSSNRKSYEFCNEKFARHDRCKYYNRRSNRNSKWSCNNSCFKS